MPRFSRDENDIFVNEDALRESYTPDSMEEREPEIAEYTDALLPVINGSEPNNIFVYGHTGLGKTEATNLLLDELKADATMYDDVEVNSIYINCDGTNTSYRVAVAVTNSVYKALNKNKRIAPQGNAYAEVLRDMWKALNSLDGTIIIVLDEVDLLEDDSILYQLPRAGSHGNLKAGVKLGVIGITNDMGFADTLDQRVQSSLGEREIRFDPYESGQLRSILMKRAAIAFRDTKAHRLEPGMDPQKWIDQQPNPDEWAFEEGMPGYGVGPLVFHSEVIDNAAIVLAAALAAQDSGNARQALDILRLAGAIARRRSDNVVTEQHVREGAEKLEEKQILEAIGRFPVHRSLALQALLWRHIKYGDLHRVKDIEDTYEELCKLEDMEPLTTRRLRSHLNELDVVGLVEKHERKRGRKGNYLEYELSDSVTVESVLEALQEYADDSEVSLRVTPPIENLSPSDPQVGGQRSMGDY